ncbi:MAG: class I SAM-dependent methyltransferase [Actinobacteria bacterium]|nr:class I SAM-dependent methyltransferase [Actinomycetota bacterium]
MEPADVERGERGAAGDAPAFDGPRSVAGIDDLLSMLDGLFAAGADRWSPDGSAWWDGFYADRDRPVPFFRAGPDESLVDWTARGLLPVGGRALDVGCGPGRDARWLAAQGWTVDGVDLSAEAIGWAREHAASAPPDVAARLRLVAGDVFAHPVPAGGYDLVHDSGCFHHLPPHRRISYLDLLARALRPGGAFALTCFAAGRMGSEAPDASFYATGSLEGGLAYSEADLRRIFGHLDVVEIRPMRPQPRDGDLFGEDFLLVALFRRPA